MRGLAYGIPTIRVDGNDVLAVRRATSEARKLCAESKAPVLVEAMSYRAGHHSTSDDSTRYRSTDEIKMWMTDRCPVKRFRRHLEKRGWWDDMREENLRTSERSSVMEAMLNAERKDKPDQMGNGDDGKAGSLATPKRGDGESHEKVSFALHDGRSLKNKIFYGGNK